MLEEQPFVHSPQPLIVLLTSEELKRTESIEHLIDELWGNFGCVRVFTEVMELKIFTQSRDGSPNPGQLFLIITNDQLPLLLVEQIQTWLSIEAIFIYQIDAARSLIIPNNQKIQGIFRKLTNLLSKVFECLTDFSRKNNISISSFSYDEPRMTSNIINNIGDYSELWYPLFLDLLFNQVAINEVDRKRQMTNFVNQARRFYASDPKKLQLLNNFDHETNGYSAEKAIKYYTMNHFLYLRVNRALRQKNFKGILDLTFFFNDIQLQLQQEYAKFEGNFFFGEIIELYRGQKLSIDEIEMLIQKRREGSLITVNSYFSTTLSEEVAMIFATASPTEHLLPVLFKIKAEYKDPSLTKHKPFAYISSISPKTVNEFEVLFSMGSFFHIDYIDFDKSKNLHVIQLTFMYDQDHAIITGDYTMLRSCSIEEKLIKIGYLLGNNGHNGIIKAEAFFQHFLSDSTKETIHVACCVGLGWLQLKQRQYHLAISDQEKALQINESLLHKNDYLQVSSYSCMGAAYREMKNYLKALECYKKAYAINPTMISIDKYAFYRSFDEIASVNIACIHKINGEIELAWSCYQEILATAMIDSDAYRAATYLAVAEAGFPRSMGFDNEQEKIVFIENWRRFIDISMSEMSSSYRRSIISGILSIGLRLENSDSTNGIAIQYYRDIIQASIRYINVSAADYHIILNCHKKIAKLYRKKRAFVQSIFYATEGLKMCWVSDYASISEFYEVMSQTYKANLQEQQQSLSPIDIQKKINFREYLSEAIDPVPISIKSVYSSSDPILSFDHREFSFGQHKNSLNGNLFKETDLKRCQVYCLLKQAVAEQEQQKMDRLEDLLTQARTLLLDDPQLEWITKTNLAYLNGCFDEVSKLYESLSSEKNNTPIDLLIHVNALSYIGHLREKMGRIKEAEKFYLKAIEIVEENDLVCKNDEFCFFNAAEFYRRQQDIASSVSIYQRLIYHILNVEVDVSSFQKEFVNQLLLLLVNSINDSEHLFCILKHLLKIASLSPSSPGFFEKIDCEVQSINQLLTNKNESALLSMSMYKLYHEVLLEMNPSSLSTYTQSMLPIYQSIINAFVFADDASNTVKIYQQWLEIIIKYGDKRDKIIEAVKHSMLLLDMNKHFNCSLQIYDDIYQWTLKHPAPMCNLDIDLTFYIFSRLEAIATISDQPKATFYRQIIRIFDSLSRHQDLQFGISYYLDKLQYFHWKLILYDPDTTVESCCCILDAYMLHKPHYFDQTFEEIFQKIREKPDECLLLLKKYHINLTKLITSAVKRISNLHDEQLQAEPFSQSTNEYINICMQSFTKKACRIMNSSYNQERLSECWSECIGCLLEIASKYDAYLAECYTRLGDYELAVNVFDPLIYTEIAVKYCPNACRRYLIYVYPQSTTPEDLELIFADHFQVIDGKKVILPLKLVDQ